MLIVGKPLGMQRGPGFERWTVAIWSIEACHSLQRWDGNLELGSLCGSARMIEKIFAVVVLQKVDIFRKRIARMYWLPRGTGAEHGNHRDES